MNESLFHRNHRQKQHHHPLESGVILRHFEQIAGVFTARGATQIIAIDALAHAGTFNNWVFKSSNSRSASIVLRFDDRAMDAWLWPSAPGASQIQTRRSRT